MAEYFPNTAHSGISSYAGKIAHQLQVHTAHITSYFTRGHKSWSD